MRFEDVTFENGDTRLAGTLALPESEGPFPAVALVDGSGPGVRKDPYFLALADLFVSANFAVLAWDKPGCGDSTGNWLDQTFNDRANEAISAVHYLQSHPGIKSNSIGLWGISQGGWVSPLAASLSSDIAFVIAVSGPGISPANQEIYRIEHELRADGFSEEKVVHITQLYTGLLELLREGRTFDELAAALPIEEMKTAEVAPYMPGFEPAGADFMKGIMDFDPRPILSTVTCPFLGIWGETDRLLPALQSAEIFRQALQEAGNTDFTLKIFADADHGIYTSETGSRKERAARRERDELTFAPGYFALMKDWLQDRFYAPVTTTSRSHFPDVS